jgi:protein arginine kinase
MNNFIKTSLWEKSDSPIWVASHFFLRRNLSTYPFPNKMTEAEEKQVTTLLKNSLLQSSLLQNPSFFTQMNEPLSERFFPPKEEQLSKKNGGYVIDENGIFLATLNHQDHLLMQYSECQSNWKEGWKKLQKIEAELSKACDFAFSPTFGYLTANPSQAGTGLLIQAILHLPALIHLNQIDQMEEEEVEVETHGLEGIDEFLGGFVIVENRFTIGLTEDHILQAVHKTATKLLTLEKNLRGHLKQNPNPTLINAMSRAYGLLLNSYQIETKEAFSALSLLKLGLDLQWITGIDDSKINTLFFSCQRGHLITLLQEEIPQEVLSHKRAEFLQKELEEIKLVIP